MAALCRKDIANTSLRQSDRLPPRHRAAAGRIEAMPWLELNAEPAGDGLRRVAAGHFCVVVEEHLRRGRDRRRHAGAADEAVAAELVPVAVNIGLPGAAAKVARTV